VTAEAVLARWRREYPQMVVALLRDGQGIEDAEGKAERLVRERREREAAHLRCLTRHIAKAGPRMRRDSMS
jgi:hypothetical protein